MTNSRAVTKFGIFVIVAAGFTGAFLIFFGGSLMASVIGLLTLSDPSEALRRSSLGFYGTVAVALAIGSSGIFALRHALYGGLAAMAFSLVGIIFGGPVITQIGMAGVFGGLLCVMGRDSPGSPKA